MSTLSVIKIQDGLWQFCELLRENHSVDAWLLTGKKRALLIDALQEITGVYEEIKKLTSLPVDCLIEHGHGDHDGPACREIKAAGGAVYIHPADIPLAMGPEGNAFPTDFFTPIQDGAAIDLGGLALDILQVAGHTPGSLVALDRGGERLFSSDTLGSGPFWVQLPHSLPLHEVRDQIKAFYGKVKQYGKLILYPGHRYQSPGPIGLEYIADTLEAIELILEGKITGTETEPPLPLRQNRWFNVNHKSSRGLCYDPDKL